MSYRYITCLIGMLLSGMAMSQIPSFTVGDTSNWSHGSKLDVFFSQNAYGSYWKGGGVNSIATRVAFEVEKSYLKGKTRWDNLFKFVYGVIKIGDIPFQKNEDWLELDSKYSQQFSRHLKLSGSFNLRTRLHDMYQVMRDGSRGQYIGNFLAPGWINIGSGLDYFTKKKVFTLYYSPVNSKITIVRIEELRDQFLPVEFRDQSVRYELGSLLRLEFKKEIMTNVILHTRGEFFTNHLDNFGKIDVEVENRINFVINRNLSANLHAHLIYDEDILFDIENENGEITGRGPRTQFREVLNIGFSHTF